MTIEIERRQLINQIILASPPVCGNTEAARIALEQWSPADLRKLRNGLPTISIIRESPKGGRLTRLIDNETQPR